MKYLKDAYYLNAYYVNSGDPYGKNFDYFVDFLKNKGVTEIYEAGFEFGHRLDKLEQESFVVKGGVEFDPNFGLYKKWTNLFKRGWEIHFTQLDFWCPKFREVVITNNLFSSIAEEDREHILNLLKEKTKYLYLNEEVSLNLDKEDEIYVNVNERWDDLKSNSRNNPELPSFESLKNRIKESEELLEGITEEPTESDDSSSSV